MTGILFLGKSLTAKASDRFPIRIGAKESELLGRFRQEYSKIINDEIEKFQATTDFDIQSIQEFWKNFLIIEPLKMWSVSRESFYKNLILYNRTYSELHHEYLKVVNEAAEIASDYFSEPSKNLQKLNEFSDNLQQTAIQPSFELLAETKINLETVIEKIQKIDFA
ncbi:hypothetical protein ACKFKG_16360 [Phormidesmis sp. 146-35]